MGIQQGYIMRIAMKSNNHLTTLRRWCRRNLPTWGRILPARVEALRMWNHYEYEWMFDFGEVQAFFKVEGNDASAHGEGTIFRKSSLTLWRCKLWDGWMIHATSYSVDCSSPKIHPLYCLLPGSQTWSLLFLGTNRIKFSQHARLWQKKRQRFGTLRNWAGSHRPYTLYTWPMDATEPAAIWEIYL